MSALYIGVMISDATSTVTTVTTTADITNHLRLSMTPRYSCMPISSSGLAPV